MREQKIDLKPEDELTNVRQRLENTKSKSIILVIPPQTQLRSLVEWRLLRSHVRQSGQDVKIISSDRQIRAVAKAAGFQVSDLHTSPLSDRPRPIKRPVRSSKSGKSSQDANKLVRNGENITHSLTPGKQQMPLPTSESPSISNNSGDVNREFDSAVASSFEIEDMPNDSQSDLTIESIIPIPSLLGAGNQEDDKIDLLVEDNYIARSIREVAQRRESDEVSPAFENTETSRDNLDISNKIPMPSERENDPFEYMEDIHPVTLSEQRDSTFIHVIDQNVPDISIGPIDVYGSEVEDLGDYDMPPLSILTGNAMQPSSEVLGNEDDLLRPSSRIVDQPARITPSTEAGREPQPIIQPLLQRRRVTINPPSNQTKKPVNSQGSRDVTPPPPSVGRRGGARGCISRRSFIPLLVILAILLFLFFVGIAISNNFLPGVAYSATATIIPASRDLKDTFQIIGVDGIPVASQRQIQIRLLSNTTTSQATTIMVSGVGYVPAIAARGSLTFYNALPYSQAIIAGTVFMLNNGVQVANDKPAIIPAAKPPTEGSVTIPAHSITIGTKGNIPAFAFNDVPCCVAGITIQNRAAFSGGKDQRNYTFVQQSDIDGIVNAEKLSLIKHTESALLAEFFQNERLINPDKCTSDIISDHVAGDKATSVTVILTITCTGEVYDWQAAQSMAANLLTKEAENGSSPGYSLVGRIIPIIKPTELNGTIYFLVKVEGIWAYQFSDSGERMLTELIAGKRSTDAQSILIHHVFIAKADIQVSGFLATTLPDDPRRINIVIQSVHGL
ncbi:MAG: baseplate J/gp47 family protein [Ktedonobacteraceae bacterium]